MQADAGLVEDVERADETAAEGGGQVDALALAAAEAVAEAVEGEVTQADVDQEGEAAAYLYQQTLRNPGVVLVQSQVAEPLQQVGHGHGDELADGLVADADVRGLGAQTAAVAVGAGGFAAVVGEHDAVLYLVLLGADELEEAVDALRAGDAVPQHVLLLLREVVVGTVDGEADLTGGVDELALELAHLGSAPAHHGIVIDRQAGVGNDAALGNAHNLAEALAARAGAVGVVEVEHLVGRLGKGYAVGLEARGKAASDGLSGLLPHQQLKGVVTLEEGRLGRVGKACQGVLVGGRCHSVDKEHTAARVGGLGVDRRQQVLYLLEVAVSVHHT